MPTHPLLPLLIGCALMTCSAAENMLGRQSQNEGLPVLPAPAVVTVDGALSEWDWSSRIWCFADVGVRARYSAEVAAMWDAEALFVAVKWRDPTPMHSKVDPQHTPGDGWKSDALQLRVRTADQTSWVTSWYFAPKHMPVLDIARWKDMDNSRQGSVTTLLTGTAGTSDLGQGAALAYRADPDGKGYAQEMRIPWKLLYANPTPPKAGDALRLGMEFLWGDPTGGLNYPVHRYADNMQPGATSREFFWDNWRVWGEATLLAAGGVTQRRYLPDGGLIAGTVPVLATVPADAARFTLVIEDQQGQRVRNLAADCDPTDYAKKTPDGKHSVEVLWDCLDDQGRPVAPGTYAVRGLSHAGLSAEYSMCFYNPGTPPWTTADGRGAWGADHHPPSGVAAGKDMTVVSWGFAEGGSGIIGIGLDGRKCWSQYRGAAMIAADDAYVYAFQSASWHATDLKADYLCRYALSDGSPRIFTVGGQERPLDLPVHRLLGLDQPVQVTGMAVAGGRLALALAHGEIAIFDAATLALHKRFPAVGAGGLAWAPDGTLYALLGMPTSAPVSAIDEGHNRAAIDDLPPGRVHRIDPTTGVAQALELTGLGRPSAITVDRDGTLLVADTGPDCQVKAFTGDGRLAYTCGRPGGRPIRGTFDAQAMMHMSAVAVDARGEIWVTEAWDYPRRVSVWKRDGSLARDYIGNTGYNGVGCYLHDQRPGLAYCGPIEMTVDPVKRTWTVTKILWVPDPAKGERFPILTGSNSCPIRFTATFAGRAHEYLYHREEAHGVGGPQVIFMETAQGWRPVAAVCLVGQMLELVDNRLTVLREASGEWAGFDAGDGCFWNDTNGDGIPQRSECTIIPTTKKSQIGLRITEPVLALNSGWGGRIASDLSFAAFGAKGALTVYRPLRITDEGAPVYGPEGVRITTIKMGDAGDTLQRTDTLLLPEEGRLIAVAGNHGWKNLPFISADLVSGAVRWSYPNDFAGVHGSHFAPMPRPGLLIGPLKICGTARMDGDIGTVLMLRGNLGQDFFFTTDGLCVGALFMDTRFPRESLPEDEQQLIGRPMEGFSEGGEPFNGWFGRQSDGVVRQVSGIPLQGAMIQEIRGLEGIQRMSAPPITVDAATIARAAAEAQSRLAVKTTAKVARIARTALPLICDGSGAGWDAVNVDVVKVEREGQPDQAEVRLAWDAQALYVRWDVRDASPWKNGGSDLGRLFKTGDCVDLCLRTNASATGDQPAAGDLRVVIGPMEGKPIAVLMRPIEAGAPAEVGRSYTSPVSTKVFARVAAMTAARIAVVKQPGGYRVEALLPLAELGLTSKPGTVLRGDVGFVSSDPQGVSNTARTCWSNQNTNLVNDLPAEAWLYPGQWGELRGE